MRISVSSLMNGGFNLLTKICIALILSISLLNHPTFGIAEVADNEQVLQVYFPFKFTELSYANTSRWVTQMVWSSLVGSLYDLEFGDATDELIPQLADGPPMISDDGLVYTVKLKENLKFSSGDPLKADDVVFSYNTWLTPGFGRGGYNVIIDYFESNSSIVELDELTIQFTFKNPGFLNQAMLTWVIIDREKYAEKYNNCLNGISASCIWNNQTGSDFESAGPYMIDRFDLQSQIIEVIKNPYYHRKDQWADRIVFHTNVATNMTSDILENGNASIIHHGFEFNNSILAPFESYDTQKILSSFLIVQELGLNLIHPIFGTGEDIPDENASSTNDEVQATWIRKAISHTIDRDYIVNQYYDNSTGSYSVPAATPIHPIEPGFNESYSYHPYNKTLAKEFMTKAGYNFNTIVDSNIDGDYGDFGDTTFFNISLLVPSGNAIRISWSEYIAEQLTEIGIGITRINVTGDVSNRIWGHKGKSIVPLYDDGGYDAVTLGFFHSLYTLLSRFSSGGLCDGDMAFRCENYINVDDAILDNLGTE
ncbi:MAG: ABC transporter substrate-binding protein, partial [Candidatus Kariarchaeaceae archaeon]